MDMDRLTVLNKHNEPSYGNPQEVLGEVVQEYDTTTIREFVSDSKAKDNFSRPALPKEILFPAINIRKLDNVYVYDAFLTFDESHIYSDSSIIGGLEGRSDDAILKWAKQKLKSSSKTVSFEHSSESVLVIHNEGGGTWGHHLIQNFPKILFAQKYFPEMKIVLPKIFCNPNLSRGKLLDIYGVNRNSLVPVDPTVTYAFKSVYILDFLFDPTSAFIHPWALAALKNTQSCFEASFTSKWFSRRLGKRAIFDPIKAFIYPWALAALRNINSSFKENSTSKLFVRRLSKRAIENQVTIEDCLEESGFSVITQGHKNLEEQIERWSVADIVVSTLGSDLSNLIFLKENSSIISLSPDWFGDMFFYNLAYAAKLNWFEIRCGEVGTLSSSSHRFNNFFVNKELLANTVKRVEALNDTGS